MDQLNQIANTLSLTMGAAWASGINLYAAILVLGILGKTGNITLPAHLHILMNPLVIGSTFYQLGRFRYGRRCSNRRALDCIALSLAFYLPDDYFYFVDDLAAAETLARH